jgi:hypothetical protein
MIWHHIMIALLRFYAKCAFPSHFLFQNSIHATLTKCMVERAVDISKVNESE